MESSVMNAMRTFFEGSAGRDFVAKANAEQATAVQEQRQVWATELKRNHETALAAARQWETDHAKMIAAEEPLEKKLKDMQAVRSQRASERRAAVMGYDRRRDILTRQLEESAPPEIAAAEGALRDEVQATLTRRDRVMQRTIDGERVAWSNFESVDDRVAAIRPAIAAVRELVRLALTPPELATRIEKIHAGLPTVETRPAHLREGGAA